MENGITYIAVVDDDKEIRMVLDNYLSTEPNYVVELLESGNALVEYVKTKTPDIILLDIEMPGLSGIETFDKIKAMGLAKVPPVIFLTGKEDKSTVLKCISRGADGYLIKPVDRNSLLQRIKEVISKYQKYKQNKTVLIIDDDVDFLKIAKAKLSKYYKVLTVNSGKTALEYLTSHDVDLIILDFYMPLYDGKSVLTILRKRERSKDIPVIIASSVNMNEIASACKEALPEAIIPKPVNMDELLGKMQLLME